MREIILYCVSYENLSYLSQYLENHNAHSLIYSECIGGSIAFLRWCEGPKENTLIKVLAKLYR